MATLPSILTISALIDNDTTELETAYRSLCNGNVVEKDDTGFQELVATLEGVSGAKFDNPNMISSEGKLLITGLLVNEELLRGDLKSFDLTKESLNRSLEITSHIIGVKILGLGFVVQILGTLIMNLPFL